MSENLVRKSKWFWAWQDDKEEAWLQEMARQGLHLKAPGVFGQYTFAKGEPRDVVYRFDYVTTARKTEDYFQLFRDAGWEHVGELGGWQYWRKPVEAGKTPEIFTDVDSKIQKYRRLIGVLILVISICITNFLTFGNTQLHIHSPLARGLIDGMYSILFLACMIMAVSVLMLLRRISTLRRK